MDMLGERSVPFTRALVTGGTGFVGRHLVRALAASGVNVTVFGPEGAGSFSNENVRMLAGDIRDTASIRAVVTETQPDVVFHLAAYGTFTQEKDIGRMIDVNVKGTAFLLEALSGIACRSIVMVGSAKEYAPSRTPIREDATLAPWDAYGASKASAALLAAWYAQTHHLPITILRLAPVYGSGDADTRFIQTVIRSANMGSPFTLTVGSQVRNFVYIDDVIDAFLRAGQHTGTGDVIHIGGAETTSFRDIVRVVEGEVGKALQLIEETPAPAKDDSWVLDIQKARDVLGWTPRVSLREGIRRVIQE